MPDLKRGFAFRPGPADLGAAQAVFEDRAEAGANWLGLPGKGHALAMRSRDVCSLLGVDMLARMRQRTP
jgi:hypothetical protein